MKFMIIVSRLVWLLLDSRIARRVGYFLRAIQWSGRLGELGKDSKINKHVVIRAPNNVHIGNGVAIAEFVHIWGGGGVEIGDESIIASHVSITSQTHDVRAINYKSSSIMSRVIVGRNVWIGSGSIILPGITIGDNSIVGAGSVVTKDIPSNSIAYGVPAKVHRKIK